jgi:chaperonin cofactor prefoldin
LLSALSGTVEIEKQHAQRMKELREDSEKYSAIAQQTRKENERLAELESKIEELFSKHGINSNPTEPTDKP